MGPHGTLQESGGEAGSVKHGIFFAQTLYAAKILNNEELDITIEDSTVL